MDSRIESTQALISQHAKGKLITEPVNRLPFFALEQGGVNLTKDGIPLEDFKQYFDVDQLDQEKLLLIVDRLIIPSAAVFNFEVGERLTDIIGLSSVIKDLRAAVFEGAEKGRLIDLVNESRTPLPVQMPFLKELLGKQPKITQQLAEISAKVDVTLNVVGKDTPTTMEIQLHAWKNILEEIGNALLDKNTTNGSSPFQESVAQEKQKLESPKVSGSGENKELYREKLQRLLNHGQSLEKISQKLGDLTDEQNQEGRQTWINRLSGCFHYFRRLYQDEHKISDVQFNDILNNIGLTDELIGKFKRFQAEKSEENSVPSHSYFFEGKSQDALVRQYQKAYQLEAEYRIQALSKPERGVDLADLLSEEFLKTTFSLNELRVLNRLHDPEHGIDLFQIRQQIARLKIGAERILQEAPAPEKFERLSLLDEKVAELLAPIANRIAELFPHNSATFLSNVLTYEEAVCAGKVNATLPVLRFLGLKTREVCVNRPLFYNSFAYAHSVTEVDLFRSKLIIDSNFRRNRPERDNAELNLIARENAQRIISGYQVYGYFINQERLWEASDSFTRINPDTGLGEQYFASIPHAHKSLAPDKDGKIIPAGVYSNWVTILDKLKNQKAYEQYKAIALQENPHSILELYNDFRDIWDNEGKAGWTRMYSLLNKMLAYDPENPVSHYAPANLFYLQKDQLMRIDGGRDLLKYALAHAKEFIRLWKALPNSEEFMEDEWSRKIIEQANKIIQDLEPLFEEKKE